MSYKRVFYIMVAVLSIVGLLSLAAAFVGNKMLAAKSKQLTDLKLQNEVLDRQKQDVITAKANIKKYEELDRIAKQIVPQDKDQAKTVREIIRFADASRIKIKSISFPPSTLGAKNPAATTSGSAATAPTPVATPTVKVSQVKPVPGLPGVYELEVAVTSEAEAASFPSLIDFLHNLEANRRTSQVSQMVITPKKEDRNRLTFTITFKVYVKP